MRSGKKTNFKRARAQRFDVSYLVIKTHRFIYKPRCNLMPLCQTQSAEPRHSSPNLFEAVQHLIITAAGRINAGAEQMPVRIPETAIILHATRTFLRLNTLL